MIYDHVFTSNLPVSLLHLMRNFQATTLDRAATLTLKRRDPDPTADPPHSASDTSNVHIPPDMEAYNPSERELWCSARAYHRRLQLVSGREDMSADSITKLCDWINRLEKLERLWRPSGGTDLTLATDDVVAESWKSYETKDSADRKRVSKRYSTDPRSFGESLKRKITRTRAVSDNTGESVDFGACGSDVGHWTKLVKEMSTQLPPIVDEHLSLLPQGSKPGIMSKMAEGVKNLLSPKPDSN